MTGVRMAEKQTKKAAAQPDRAPSDILMVDLLSAVYWFDEALQAGLADRGWSHVTRMQSLVLANLASGVQRAAQLARNLGVSRQAMSQTLAEMEARGLVATRPDPSDKRALIVEFSAQSAALQSDALQVLASIERELAARIGTARFDALKEAAGADWGPPPTGPARDDTTA